MQLIEILSCKSALFDGEAKALSIRSKFGVQFSDIRPDDVGRVPELAVPVAWVVAQVIAHGRFRLIREWHSVALVETADRAHGVSDEIRIAHMKDARVVGQRVAQRRLEAPASPSISSPVSTMREAIACTGSRCVQTMHASG